MDVAFEYFMCAFCGLLVMPREGADKNAPYAMQCSVCNTLFCEDCIAHNQVYSCPKPLCKSQAAPEQIHFKVKEILEAMRVFCPGCKQCLRYMEALTHVKECEQVRREHRYDNAKLGELIAENLQKAHGVQLAKKSNIPIELLVFDKDRLRVYVYNMLQNNVSMHPVHFEVTGDDKLPTAKATGQPCFPHNFNYVQFGRPAQVYLIGGGSIDSGALNMHKECRKLVKDNKTRELRLELVAPLTHPRNGHAICVVGESHLVVTGSRIGQCASAEMYSIEKNQWSQLPSMNQGRYYHSSCAFNDEAVYVFCGIEASSKKYINSIERLCVTDKGPAQWQNIEVNYGPEIAWPLMTPRQGLGSCQVDESRIMLIGGFAQGVYTNDSFYFDATTNRVEKGPNVSSDIFPFQVPTLGDKNNQIVYSVDWVRFKLMKFEKSAWSQVTVLKQ